MPSASTPTTRNAKTRQRIRRVLKKMVQKRHVAGLQVAVRHPSGKTWVFAAGNAEFNPPRAIEDDTVFSIASVSKTFVAALILQLVDEGKLSLNDHIGKYVPDAPHATNATIRQLLSHTSGIYDYFANPKYIKISQAWLKQAPQSGLKDREHQWTYDEIMSLVKRPYCRAGACYHYSNTNYVLLGKIAEIVGKAPIDEQLRRRFFDPLGLNDTYFQPAEMPPADAAHGFWSNGSAHTDHTRSSAYRPFMAAVSVAGAAGAIASTASDLTTWAAALYGGHVLSKKSLTEMTTILPAGTYGLGTDVAVFAGHRAYGHRGGLRGFESSMWYFPDSGVAIALLSNQGNWFVAPGIPTDVPMKKIVKAVLG